MKINEATLAAFATSQNAPSDKEGWLWKKGELNKAFQRRYFVLKGNLLFYFERRSDREPVGVIILEGCIVELAEEDTERFGFKICFHQAERSRVYHMGTELHQTLMEWMRLLACASHDYMKLMVYELQQKLSELDAVVSDSCAAARTPPPPAGGLAAARRNPFAPGKCPDNEKPGPDSWKELHDLYGGKIAKDYEEYLSKLL